MIMSEDITYCLSECNDMKCFRNKGYIKIPIPHSFAFLDPHSFAFLEGTEDCHKMQNNESKSSSRRYNDD